LQEFDPARGTQVEGASDRFRTFGDRIVFRWQKDRIVFGCPGIVAAIICEKGCGHEGIFEAFSSLFVG
jgi:hypothetical protein